MHRFRWILVTLMLASMMFAWDAYPATAQVATPISVPTPTAVGCDQIPAYAGERQTIMNELIDGIAAIFPTVATPITEHGDQMLNAIMAVTPDQLGQLSTLYDETASRIEKLAVPPIAVFYNQQVVSLYRLSAKTFAEAQAADLMTAGERNGAQLNEIATAIGTYADAASLICPAFVDVIEVDQTRIGL